MILIADSGSTKTDWVIAGVQDEPQAASVYHTQGITPIHQSPDIIRQIIAEELIPQIQQSIQSISAVFFYGSGCTAAHAAGIQQLLSEAFPKAEVEAQSDLLAAARSLCIRQEGIACILGTGANSCLYNGKHIVQNTPALGYVLGDEGSGAVLGRMFLNAIFKNPAMAFVRDDYLTTMHLTMDDVIQRVYREPLANRFLASTSLYISRHLDHTLIRQMVIENFCNFFRYNLVQYHRRYLPVHFVGSMAYYYRELLRHSASLEGFSVGKIEMSPLQGLLTYHAAR